MRREDGTYWRFNNNTDSGETVALSQPLGVVLLEPMLLFGAAGEREIDTVHFMTDCFLPPPLSTPSTPNYHCRFEMSAALNVALYGCQLMNEMGRDR